jgi:hypothetical protein
LQSVLGVSEHVETDSGAETVSENRNKLFVLEIAIFYQ